MEDAKFGQNQTGAELTPENIKLMLNACKKFPHDVEGDDTAIEQARISIIKEANEIGSVPFAQSIQGAVKTSFSKVIGNQPEVFLDKLGERLAFERTGVRLYEAAHAKALGLNASKKILQKFEHIKDEEAEHMEMVKKAIKKLGADPTAMTPSADMTGVMGMGLIQILTDPRTNMAQCLDALLNAELIDNAGWEMLIDLANDRNEHQLVKNFEKALIQEQEHLLMIKELLQEQLNINT